MNYYPHHIGDFNLHTSHLTLEEEGVYRRLLDYYYDTELPIPLETQSVIRRLRLGSHSDTVGLILEEFFHKMDDGWHNNRADFEIEVYQKKAKIAQENGRKGGRPKKNKGSKTQSVSVANPAETKSKANQEPRTNNHNQEPSLKDTSVPDSIFQYWQSVMQKQNSRLTPNRRAKIKSRLEHFTEDQIRDAISGCSKSEFHMGKNDNKAEYNSIELICRNDEKLEFFLDLNTKRNHSNYQLEEWVNAV